MPIAWPSAWSAAQSERFMASPAVRLPQASCRRASRSEPSRDRALERRGRCGAPPRARRRPRAGCRRARCRPPIAWASASTPECAVGPGGRPSVSSGIDERVLGAHVPVREADLAVAVGVGQDRRPGDLGARAGRRRAEHERQRRRGERAAALEVVARPSRRRRRAGARPWRGRAPSRRRCPRPHRSCPRRSRA